MSSTLPVTHYATPAAFLDAGGPALLAHEVENNLMLGIALRLRKYPERTRMAPYMATWGAPDRPEAFSAALMTPPYNLQVYNGLEPRTGPGALAGLEAIAQDLRANNWTLPGVTGHPHAVADFTRIWTARTGITFRDGMRMRIYQLTQVIAPARPPAGRLLMADETYVPLVAAWMNAFNEDCFGAPMREDAFAAARWRIELGEIALWEDGGQIVSMAAKGRETQTTATVNLVYTPRSLRGKGYASGCVAALSQRLLDDGWKSCVLFTDLANPTSNSIYQQIGYRPICDFHEALCNV